MAELQQLHLQAPSPWVLDTGATSHMTLSDGILLSRLSPPHYSIIVGSGNSLPVTARGPSILPTSTANFSLRNILVVPTIIRNLLSVRQFSRDNLISIEFDPF